MSIAVAVHPFLAVCVYPRDSTPVWCTPEIPNADADDQRNGSQRHDRITLVSFAKGASFKKVLDSMRVQAQARFSSTMLWGDDEFLADPLVQKQAEQLRFLDAMPMPMGRRPYCAAFKPLMLLRALQTTSSEYVLWTDASRYFSLALDLSDIQHSLRQLKRAGADSLFGLVHCSWSCTAPREGWRGTWPRYAFADELIDFSQEAPHYPFADMVVGRDLRVHRMLLNTHMLLRNDAQNRELMRAWLAMALERPHEFCKGTAGDQAALTILAINRSLPVVDPCPYMESDDGDGPVRPHGSCYTAEKSYDWAVHMLARKRFNVTTLDATPDPRLFGSIHYNDTCKRLACPVRAEERLDAP